MEPPQSGPEEQAGIRSWKRLEDIPTELQLFALRDLDSGEWTLLNSIGEEAEGFRGEDCQDTLSPPAQRSKKKKMSRLFHRHRSATQRKQGKAEEQLADDTPRPVHSLYSLAHADATASMEQLAQKSSAADE